MIIVLFLSIVRRPVVFSLTVQRILTALEQILLIIAIAWMILRVVESFEEVVRTRARRRGKVTLLPLLPVVRKTTKILIATFAGLAVLHSFGVNVIAVLAGLGVGGIAVALAAQKTIENFIAGITLYADQPVLVGDFCRFAGMVGTVEEVGLRSTRVRTLDRTVVSIPNAEFANFQIENFAKRERIWYHPTISLRYETTQDQIRCVLVEVRRMLYAHPKVDSASARIRFVGFGSSSLDLRCSATSTSPITGRTWRSPRTSTCGSWTSWPPRDRALPSPRRPRISSVAAGSTVIGPGRRRRR
jgi:MscS family membrane protein